MQPRIGKKRLTRTRMTYEQKEYLKARFDENPNWSAADIERLSMQLGLGQTKIYKWNWDEKKKVLAEAEPAN